MNFNVDNPSQSGVYKIVNTVSNKIYVGSACNLYNRYRTHKSTLIKGIHHNDHLQKSFNKHGLSAFEFSVIEYCNTNELTDREKHHIELNYGPNCYNINKSPRCEDINKRHIISINLVSPDNINYSFRGTVRDISREMCSNFNFKSENYVYQGLTRLLNGKSKHFIGWRLTNNADFDWKTPIKRKYNTKQWNVKLVSPCGEVFGPICNLEKFCREHGIRYSSGLINLINGKTRYINGWYIEGNLPVTKNSRVYNVIIEDSDGIRYGPITNLTEFARNHSASQSALRQFIVGNRPKYKNWKIIKPLESNDE